MTPSGLSAERVLQLLEPILISILLIKLFHEQLQRRYPYFALYLFGFMLQTLIPILMGWRFESKRVRVFLRCVSAADLGGLLSTGDGDF